MVSYFEFVVGIYLNMFTSTALQRLRANNNVEDDLEEMRIEDEAQKQETKASEHINVMVVNSI